MSRRAMQLMSGIAVLSAQHRRNTGSWANALITHGEQVHLLSCWSRSARPAGVALVAHAGVLVS